MLNHLCPRGWWSWYIVSSYIAYCLTYCLQQNMWQMLSLISSSTGFMPWCQEQLIRCRCWQSCGALETREKCSDPAVNSSILIFRAFCRSHSLTSERSHGSGGSVGLQSPHALGWNKWQPLGVWQPLLSRLGHQAFPIHARSLVFAKVLRVGFIRREAMGH